MIVSASKFLTTCAATVLLAVALSACGGGGGDGPVTDEAVVDPTPEPIPGLESAIDRAADAFFRAGASAIDAAAACVTDDAACDASDDALAALDRASAAYDAAVAATTLADAERAARATEQAAAEAAAAAAIAEDVAAGEVDPQPMPDPDPVDECELDDPPEYCQVSIDPPSEELHRIEAAYARAVDASDSASLSAYEAGKACEVDAAACDVAATAAIAAAGAAIAAEAAGLATTAERAEKAAADAVQAAMDAADAAADAKRIAIGVPDPMPEPEPDPEPMPEPIADWPDWPVLNVDNARSIVGGSVLALSTEDIRSRMPSNYANQNSSGGGSVTCLDGDPDKYCADVQYQPVMTYRGVPIVQAREANDGDSDDGRIAYIGLLDYGYFMVGGHPGNGISEIAGITDYESAVYNVRYTGPDGRSSIFWPGPVPLGLRYQGVMLGMERLIESTEYPNVYHGDSEVRVSQGVILNDARKFTVEFTNIYNINTGERHRDLRWEGGDTPNGWFTIEPLAK